MIFSTKSLAKLFLVITMNSQVFSLIQGESTRKTVMIASSRDNSIFLSGTKYEYTFNKGSGVSFICSVELTQNGNFVVNSHTPSNEWQLKWQSNSGEEGNSVAQSYYIHLQKNFGNLVIYRGDPHCSDKPDVLWSTLGQRTARLLTISEDCDLYLQKRDGTDIWTTSDSIGTVSLTPTLSPSKDSTGFYFETKTPSLAPIGEERLDDIFIPPSAPTDINGSVIVDIGSSSSPSSAEILSDSRNDDSDWNTSSNLVTLVPNPVATENVTAMQTSISPSVSTKYFVPSQTQSDELFFGNIDADSLGSTVSPSTSPSNYTVLSNDDENNEDYIDGNTTSPSLSPQQDLITLPPTLGTTGNTTSFLNTSLSSASEQSFVPSGTPSDILIFSIDDDVDSLESIVSPSTSSSNNTAVSNDDEYGDDNTNSPSLSPQENPVALKTESPTEALTSQSTSAPSPETTGNATGFLTLHSSVPTESPNNEDISVYDDDVSLSPSLSTSTFIESNATTLAPTPGVSKNSTDWQTSVPSEAPSYSSLYSVDDTDLLESTISPSTLLSNNDEDDNMESNGLQSNVPSPVSSDCDDNMESVDTNTSSSNITDLFDNNSDDIGSNESISLLVSSSPTLYPSKIPSIAPSMKKFGFSNDIVSTSALEEFFDGRNMTDKPN